MALLVENISKNFANVQAVRNLSMKVEAGEIFGFLGPNGAGKTTTIRMILDILRPDSGQITWNGTPVREIPRKAWGYLPEERGLYPKMTVEDQLIFLARLYGMPKETVKRELSDWLERFQITTYRKKRVEELSKGNQQKVQFLATILHEPDILIMDEPFSGLDPVNVNLLKDAFLEMHRRGKTIIFSTHQMETVEELCQNISIINKGQVVVEGSVRQVKRSTGRNLVRLALDNDPEIAWLDQVPGVTVTKRRQDYVEMNLAPPATTEQILQAALQQGGRITRFELAEPSLNDIFIERVSGIAQPDAPVPAATNIR
ncbi:MAG: transporter ATP-binding protein [Chloroflexi bacterium]|jgi:ABC-2 type transport system ATP-binding protein|nr:transporter ATP-binding protein [Chloroflexota bacterium]